jgi:toxin-antitoxin system PIN domain toxin
MTSFFPDVNLWMALSVAGHSHEVEAWNWLVSVPEDSSVLLCRYTQLGLLRLLSNSAVLGERVLTLSDAWQVYDGWLRDDRVRFVPEPEGIDCFFRAVTARFADKAASKWISDCYLVAFAHLIDATFVTFDKALYSLVESLGHPVLMPR